MMAEKTRKSNQPEEPSEAMATPKTVPGAGEAPLFGSSDNIFDRIGTVPVALKRAQTQPTADQPLWTAIRNRTRAIDFDSYKDFIDHVLCQQDETVDNKKFKRQLDE